MPAVGVFQKRSMKSCTAPALVFPLFTVLCLGQQSSVPAPPPETTLYANTRLVLLDVVVTDHHGVPVRNLSKSDFTVLEDGTEQPIASFEPPGHHAQAAIEENLNSGGWNNSNPSTASAMTSAGLTILVLDELDTMPMDQAYARNEIRKFLETHGPRLPEPTALMALEEKRLELLHDYTSDPTVLETAMEQHPAHLPFRLMTGEGPFGASERLADALEALREIAAANGQFAGRKNVIWIGPGFPSLNYMDAPPESKAELVGYVRETSELMWKGRLAIYTLDPRGLEVVHENVGQNTAGGFLSPPDSATGDLVFEQIAPQTGGRIFRGLNDLDAQIATSIADGDSFYALAYYPSNQDWDGGFRHIRVVMRDKGLLARTRNGYYAVPDSAPTLQEMDRMLSRAVINPLSYHSLELRASARLSGSQQRTAHLTIDLDANELHWETPRAGMRNCEITLVAAGFSPKGRVVAYMVKEFEIAVDERKYTELTKAGMVMNLAMALPPTAVRMRVVARDSTNGNMGTADLKPTGEQFH
jgi:VWFA-related protein